MARVHGAEMKRRSSHELSGLATTRYELRSPLPHRRARLANSSATSALKRNAGGAPDQLGT